MTRRVEPLDRPPDHVVDLPGSKSITNRALLLAALAEGRSRLTGVLFADDTRAMLDCIAVLGAGVDIDEVTSTVVIDGTGGTLRPGPCELHARQSGTTARFVAAAVLAGRGRYRLDGDQQMRARPMAELVAALGELGASVEATEGGLPLVIDVDRLGADTVHLDASRTSQFATGLLMVGPLLPNGLTVELEGTVVSQPYLDMTARLMADFGAEVDVDGTRYRVSPGRYRGRSLAVEPDASAASYFFGAAALTGGRVTVPGLGADALQGDVGFVDVLASMGARVEVGAGSTTVTGRPLRGVDVDLRDLSDTVPTLAVVATAASTPTTITGVGFIRAKESDRIGAVITELHRLGIEAHELDDGLTVIPGPHHPATVETYDDHRLAMAFALLGLRGPAVEIDGSDCVAKTFPDYFDVLDRLRSRPDPAAAAGSDQEEDGVGESELTVIAIDGPAGSGKSTVARAVAERLSLEYLDTGAMYRAVTYAAIARGIDPADADDVAEVAREMDLAVDADGVRVDGHDATTEIRGPEVTRAVSVVAANPEVRRELRSRQREWARRRGGGVMEGRDIGTVVFPDARLKVYLTASPEVRAGRRAQEVTDLDYETVAADIARRDALDQGRDDSPLVEADDAITIDTSGLSIDEVVDAVEAALR